MQLDLSLAFSTGRRAWRRLHRSSLGALLAVTVPLSYETSVPPGGHGDLDSPAVWLAPNANSSFLLVTDKTQDYVEIHDPVRNLYLGRMGGHGTTAGRFSRPNSVAVGYGVATSAGPLDVAFVVERTNHRISVFALPFGFYLGSIGDAVLREPMGIAVSWDGTQPQIWITDIGFGNQRVFVFDVVPSVTGLTGTQRLAFTASPTSILESIVVDRTNGRALVCDEHASDVMVFDLQGIFLGRFGAGHFVNHTEGIAIYDTGNGAGYVIVTDQMASPVEWEVFDRQDYHFLCNFSGVTQATDGIALVQQPLPNFPQGSLFAAHSDRAIHAYDWRNIAAATGLCLAAPGTPVDAAEPQFHGSNWMTPFRTPFHGTGTLRYRLEAPAPIDVAVYDLRGIVVARLAHTMQPAGSHVVIWDGRGERGQRLVSGVYFVRAQAGTMSYSQKVTLIR